MTGDKISESRSTKQFNGQFEAFIRPKQNRRLGSEDDTKLISFEKIVHPNLTVFKSVSAVTYEGGCPKWTGVWYPVVYHVQLDNTTYASFTLYLHSLRDKRMMKLFDEIAGSLKRK